MERGEHPVELDAGETRRSPGIGCVPKMALALVIRTDDKSEAKLPLEPAILKIMTSMICLGFLHSRQQDFEVM